MALQERLIIPKEAGRILGMSTQTVKIWMRRGFLPAVKLRTRWKIRESDLTLLIAQLPLVGPPLQTDELPSNGCREGADGDKQPDESGATGT